LRPIDTAYGGGPEVELRVRIEEFGAPAITVGPDGVVQVFWADVERRWIFSCRFLGENFSPSIAVRGPLEQLTGCRTRKRGERLELWMETKPRTYRDEVVLPARTLTGARRIDFVDLDEVAEWRGLETALNQMERFAGNPVLRPGEPGSADDGAILGDVYRNADGTWWMHTHYQRRRPNHEAPVEPWMWDGRAWSADGIHWEKRAPVPLSEQVVVGEPASKYDIRYLEDPQEENPAWRFKGLWRAPYGGPWAWLAVVSADGKTWSKVPDTTTEVNADDDLRLWIDPADVPARRFKAIAISRSFCGRVCCQWTSPDGMHWNDERDTLDFRDPFGAKSDRGTCGRILLDSWAGPDDEDELHGGYVFRDGDRWLLHYMKWTPDGHVFCALAASRDGINFSRVANGAPTLPLGAAGTWDAGRVAIREAPFRVGDTWRQYYAGCGWKHGLAGVGAKTSPWASPHSPMQMGFAEISVGRWTHLQVKREADVGDLRLVPVTLTQPRQLTVDVAGLTRPGSSLQVAVLNAATGAPIVNLTGITTDGRAVPVSSKPIPAGLVQVVARVAGHGLKLFGFDWR
jgi:hypothetical protein